MGMSERIEQTEQRAAAEQATKEEKIAQAWEQHEDPSRGAMYWWNRETDESRWTNPHGCSKSEAAQHAEANAQEHEEPVQVEEPEEPKEPEEPTDLAERKFLGGRR